MLDAHGAVEIDLDCHRLRLQNAVRQLELTQAVFQLDVLVLNLFKQPRVAVAQTLVFDRAFDAVGVERVWE